MGPWALLQILLLPCCATVIRAPEPPTSPSPAHLQVAPLGHVSVDVGAAGALPLSPVLYSMFLETEINFGSEGGLYAEQIRNRDFEALGRGDLGDSVSMSTAPASDGPQQTPGLAPNLTDYRPWTPVGSATISVENTTAPFASNPMTLRLRTSAAGDGISNPGYWGVACSIGCNLTFYAKVATNHATVPLALIATLRSAGGAVLSSTVRIFLRTDSGSNNGSSWHSYSAELPALTGQAQDNAAAGASTCTFELAVQSGAAELQLDHISVMPSDAVAGYLRRDIVEQLRQLRPGFIRTPGGSYIIGDGPLTQYNWKATVGEPAARPGHYNSAWGYWVSRMRAKRLCTPEEEM
eukprot:COSAG02_NODE_1655_length_11483_cov_3.754327_4_plen_351_part_00